MADRSILTIALASMAIIARTYAAPEMLEPPAGMDIKLNRANQYRNTVSFTTDWSTGEILAVLAIAIILTLLMCRLLKAKMQCRHPEQSEKMTEVIL